MRERLADWLVLTMSIAVGIFLARVIEILFVMLVKGLLRTVG